MTRALLAHHGQLRFAADGGRCDHAPPRLKPHFGWRVQWQTERPLRVGARVAFVAHFLGRRLAYTYEVAEWVPGERFVMRTAEGPFPMETTYTWRATPDGGTVMTLRNRGTPSGFSRWVAPLMSLAMRRANRQDLGEFGRTTSS